MTMERGPALAETLRTMMTAHAEYVLTFAELIRELCSLGIDLRSKSFNSIALPCANSCLRLTS